MQHDDLDAVLQAFSVAAAGPPAAFPSGLSAVRLVARDPASDVAVAAAVRWRETAPAHPRRVIVRNPSATPVVVDAGIVLGGGMTTRSVARTTEVPPHTETMVAVEVVGVRWWDEGDVRVIGRLPPMVMALMLQAGFGTGAGASSARTTLSSQPGLDRPRPGMSAPAAGWVIFADDRVLAAWLTDRMTMFDGTAGLSAGMIASLRAGLHGGALEAHVLDHGSAGRHWIVIPRSFALVDAVAGARRLPAA